MTWLLDAAGFGAAEAALCGATAEDWDDALTALAAEPASLALAQARSSLFADAAQRYRRLLDEMAAGYGVDGCEAAVPAARGEKQACLTALAGALESVRSECFDVVLNQLGTDAAARLERAVQNRARRVPTSWMVLDLSASEWMTLETAVRKEEREAPLSAAEISALAMARTSPDVIAAQARLELNLPALDEMFVNARRAELP